MKDENKMKNETRTRWEVGDKNGMEDKNGTRLSAVVTNCLPKGLRMELCRPRRTRENPPTEEPSLRMMAFQRTYLCLENDHHLYPSAQERKAGNPSKGKGKGMTHHPMWPCSTRPL
eukprot:Gb_08243 [translate_table: standard]